MGMDAADRDAHDALLHLLARRAGPGGTSLKKLAQWTGLSPSAVHRHLQELTVQGKAVREGRGPKVRYRARAYFAAVWVDPEQGVFESWGTNAPVDWRFPLVTRVPDEPAQEVLVRFLTRLTGKGHSGAFSVVVYGSCAEGNARDKSDLDILVFRDDPGWDAQVHDLVDESNLWAKRPLDVRLAGNLQEIPDGIARNLKEHGKTVYTSREDELAFVEHRIVSSEDE